MLPPLGIIFGLFVAFTAAQVWSDSDRASAAVSHEASALRTALVLTASFPGEPEAKLHDLIASRRSDGDPESYRLQRIIQCARCGAKNKKSNRQGQQ